MLLAHHANVKDGDFLCRKTFLSCEFSPFDLEEKKKDQTFMCYEISPDLIPQNALSDLFLATRYTIVQALTEPIFIRSNAKLVALEASSFLDSHTRTVISLMKWIRY